MHGAGVGLWDVGFLSGGFPGLALPFVPGQEVAGVVEAAAAAEEAVQVGRREGEPGLTCTALDPLANAYLRRGDVRRALRAQREYVVTAPSLFLGPPADVATMAALFIADGQAERGVRLGGAVDEASARLGFDSKRFWAFHWRWLQEGLARLGPRAASVRESGRRMSLEEARAYALSDSDLPTAIGPRLSRRESQVAELVRQGLSNRGIAERLFISERTAEYHVASLMNKLGVNTRAEIAAWTVENLAAEQAR